MITNIENKILSDITVYMKYAKYIYGEDRRETWDEIIQRNLDMHIKKFPHLKDELIENYKYVFDRKVLPSMRSLQFAGKPIEISPNRLYNCAYLPIDHIDAFSEIMFLLLSGCGVGFSVQYHHVNKLNCVNEPYERRARRFVIGDSIEGWSDAIKVLMKSYLGGKRSSRIKFDYSDIRPKGSRLVTSGGKAPGPQPLKECLVKIEGILSNKKSGEYLTPLEVNDIVCFIADAVLAGGIRRAALISLFSATDNEMISCKSGDWWEKNPQRGRANNSAVLVRHKITKEFFDKLWDRIKKSGSGEPGIFFTNDKDWGTNPCAEIALRSHQFCNLVEIDVSDVVTQLELEDRSKAAAFIGTVQAAYSDFHYLREEWIETTEKERLIGVSMTGIASGNVNKLDLGQAAFYVKTENARVSKLLGINAAARCTTVKPAGTTSLVLGTSSGIHTYHDRYYIRRIRVGKNEAIYTYLSIHNPELLEDDYFRPHDTALIKVPQKAPDNALLRTDEKALDLLERVKHVRNSWISGGHRTGSNLHNVSATITVGDDEWDEVGNWMWENRKHYNGLSVLPKDIGTYVQPPFESCSKETYEEMVNSLHEVDLSKIIEIDDNTKLMEQLACAGSSCEIT